MRSTPALLILGLVVSVPLLLIGGYIWQSGLDLQAPSSTRGWIELCDRGREDVFCKAAQHIVRDIQKPVVLIYPGVTGDHDLQKSLIRWKGRFPTARELDALVRANLFEGTRLQTGQIQSLDGQLRQVTCHLPDQRRSCRIAGLRVSQLSESWEDGTIYLPNSHKGQPNFLSPVRVQ